MSPHPKYCFLDVETTGVNAAKNGIIQIGGVICEVSGGKLIELEEFNLKVAPFPSDAIEQEALEVSGHTLAEIRTFEPPDVVHAALMKIFEKYCDKFDKNDKMFFLGYNAPFDYGFLRKWFEKVGDKYFGSWFWNPPIDVMSLAALHLASARHKLGDFKLGTVTGHLGVQLSHAHDALADAKAAKEIFMLSTVGQSVPQ